MMTDVTVATQTQLFLWSLVLGAGLSVLYDFLRVLRIEVKHRPLAVSLEDIFYFLVCAAVTFGFVLKDNRGDVRAYIFIGEAIGWIIWHMTIGEMAVTVSAAVFGVIKRIVLFWGKILLFPAVCIFRVLKRVWLPLQRKSQRFSKKVIQKGKYNLKRRRMMLYNLFSQFRKTKTPQ